VPILLRGDGGTGGVAEDSPDRENKKAGYESV